MEYIVSMISQLIRDYRKKPGLSRPKLAKQLKVSAHTLKAWELRARQPSALAAEALAARLKSLD